MIFLALNIKMPVIVNDVVSDLSKVATPLELIGLGGSFTFGAVKGNIKTLLALLMLKLVVVPVTAISISSFIFGFKGACVVTLISVFASPTAVSSFTMAEGMGGDRDLAAQTVVFTSIFSILTVFLIVATTKYLGLY